MFFLRTLVVIAALLFFFGEAFGQDRDQDFPLELGPRDSNLTRSLGTEILGGSDVFRFKKPVFRRKRIILKQKRLKPASNAGSKSLGYALPENDTSAETWEQIGITLWKAADSTDVPPQPGTARLYIKEGDKNREVQPIRVSSDFVFSRGDQVRISVESPRAGYLYILDREILGENKLGEPFQIFPTLLALGGDNSVRAGFVIDIPSQSDRLPFFKLGSTTPGYRGEMLTVIVSPTPLADFGVPSTQVAIARELVDEVERRFEADTGEYEQADSAGKPYTEIEKAASSDGKRQLTQGDPYPQTIYRVKSKSKSPIVLKIPLNVK